MAVFETFHCLYKDFPPNLLEFAGFDELHLQSLFKRITLGAWNCDFWNTGRNLYEKYHDCPNPNPDVDSPDCWRKQQIKTMETVLDHFVINSADLFDCTRRVVLHEVKTTKFKEMEDNAVQIFFSSHIKENWHLFLQSSYKLSIKSCSHVIEMRIK